MFWKEEPDSPKFLNRRHPYGRRRRLMRTVLFLFVKTGIVKMKLKLKFCKIDRKKNKILRVVCQKLGATTASTAERSGHDGCYFISLNFHGLKYIKYILT